MLCSFISRTFQTCEDIWKNINELFSWIQDCAHKMCDFCHCYTHQRAIISACGNSFLFQNCPVNSLKKQKKINNTSQKCDNNVTRWGKGARLIDWLEKGRDLPIFGTCLDSFFLFLEKSLCISFNKRDQVNVHITWFLLATIFNNWC